jgi:hypothetical protein
MPSVTSGDLRIDDSVEHFRRSSHTKPEELSIPDTRASFLSTFISFLICFAASASMPAIAHYPLQAELSTCSQVPHPLQPPTLHSTSTPRRGQYSSISHNDTRCAQSPRAFFACTRQHGGCCRHPARTSHYNPIRHEPHSTRRSPHSRHTPTTLVKPRCVSSYCPYTPFPHKRQSDRHTVWIVGSS